MKIGNYDTYYTALKINDLVGPIKGMKVSANSVVDEMGGDYSPANMKAIIKEFWGIDATDEDIMEIKDLGLAEGLSYALARVISNNHTDIGWTTHGHNGEDVPVWIYPHSEAIGTIDNTDLPKVVEYWKGKGPRTLDQLTEILYIDVDTVFDNWMLDDVTDPENPVLLIEDAELPISKDYMMMNGKKYMLGSLVVHAPATGKVYIPKKAVELIN
jgi:alkaline phosphatase